jgi:hypothetical protein
VVPCKKRSRAMRRAVRDICEAMAGLPAWILRFDVSPFFEGCTRTEPAIFATFEQSSKPPFDSPCNLRTSRSLRCAIFVRALLIASGTRPDHGRSTAPGTSSTARVSLARRPGSSKLALGTVDNSW